METPYGEIPDRLIKDMRPQDMHDYLKRRYTRRAVLRGAATLGVVAATGPMLWRQSSAFGATTPIGARWIAFGADPATQMYVSWSAGTSSGSSPAPASPQVRFGLSPAYGSTVSAQNSARVPVPSYVSGEPSQNTFYNNVLLTGLLPATTYYYSVSNDGVTWSVSAPFTTAAAGLANFKFTAFGDQAANVNTAGQMAQVAASFHPSFQLIAGDLSYATPISLRIPDVTGYDPSQWDKYLGAVGPRALSIPWQAAVGAHETEPLDNFGYAGFITRFPQPYDSTSNSPVVRTFTYGNVAVIQLDGNEMSAQETVNTGYSAGGQTAWLARTLAGYRAAGTSVDFIVVVCNACCYSSNQNHGSDGGLRDAWGPLFDQYAVDLVISGHVHAYERTNPIRNGQPTRVVGKGGTVAPDVDGTTYVCAGGGGNTLYSTWYGPTGSGDAGSATPPKIWRWSGGDTPTGGTGTSVQMPDTAQGFSAVRRAVYSALVVSVTAPSLPNPSTQLKLQTIMPAQTATTVDATTVTVIDTVTLVRTSVSALLTR